MLFFSGASKTIDEENAIVALDLETRKVTTIAHENSEGRYAEPGYLLFYREGNLMAQPFDAGALKLSGEAVPIAEKVQFSPFRYSAAFGISRSGLLVFQPGGQQQKKTLTWFDLDGKEPRQESGSRRSWRRAFPSRSRRTGRGPRSPSSPGPVGRRPCGSTIWCAASPTR